MMNTKIINPRDFTKPSRWVNKVFFHCTAADTGLIGKDLYKWVRRIHVEGQPHRWSDVGYHFIIDKKGNLMTARPLEKVPSAQRNNKGIKGFLGNRGTIAICLDGLQKERFTKAQLNTARKLAEAINDAYGGNITFHPHNQIAWKGCPVIDIYSQIGVNKDGTLK